MKPCGVILTYMSRDDFKGQSFWVKVRTIIFNTMLFVGQLFFMIVGTAVGKIKWPGKQWLPIRIVSVVIIITTSIGMLASFAVFWWPIFFAHLALFLFFICEYRNIDWHRVWRAAQCSHVRLCLRDVLDVPSINIKDPVMPPVDSYQYINFGYPEAELQYWRIDQCDGKRFEYRPPAFEPSDEFMAAVIEYAEKQVGKGYDDLQLISNGLHFIAWAVMPWLWGRELPIIKAFNRKGGLEHCTSGFTADLRWGERIVDERGIRQNIKALHKTAYSLVGREPEETTEGYINLLKRTFTIFFPGYDTAVIPPCLVAIDKNWEKI